MTAIDWGGAHRYAIAIAHRRGLGRADAEDVAQSMLLKMWQQREHIEHWSAYTNRAANNEVNQWFRRHCRQKASRLTEEWPEGREPVGVVLGWNDVGPTERDPAVIVEEREVSQETLAKFVAILPRKMLRILVLLASGLAYGQVAARVGCSETNVRVHRHRAKRKLLAAYKEVTA